MVARGIDVSHESFRHRARNSDGYFPSAFAGAHWLAAINGIWTKSIAEAAARPFNSSPAKNHYRGQIGRAPALSDQSFGATSGLG